MPGHDVPSGIRPGREDSLDVDISVARPARVYDYWLGGTENFAADRAAGDEAIAAFPGIVAAVRANRAFLARAVRYMAAAGVRQFLAIGPGISTAGHTHEVAPQAAADARIVYVDNDPIVRPRVAPGGTGGRIRQWRPTQMEPESASRLWLTMSVLQVSGAHVFLPVRMISRVKAPDSQTPARTTWAPWPRSH